MALTHNGKVIETADAIEEASTTLRDALTQARAVLAFNSHRAIDWGAQSTPAYIDEEASGVLVGKKYSRQEVSNAVGSLAAVIDLIDAGHLGNLNKLARTPK
jgi:hypothetical protein